MAAAPSSIRFWFTALAVTVSIAALGVGIWRGPDAYRQWKHDRFVARAKEALEKDDTRSASLHLRKALLSQPDNVASARLMARLAEESRSPQTVGWRERIAELEPGVGSNYLAWADSAVAYGDMAAAAKALNLASDSGSTNAHFHLTSAMVAAAQQREIETLQHLAAAVQANPDDDTLRFKLAAIRMASTNEATSKTGRREVESFLPHRQLRPSALRQLTTHAIAAGQQPAALQWSQQLTQLTNAVFGDQLLRLEALHLARDAQENAQLERAMELARREPDHALALGRWLVSSRQPKTALTWMNALDGSLRTNLPGALITVDGFAGTTNWVAIPPFLADQNWQGYESMRHALTAHAWRQLDNSQGFKGAWSRALREATASRAGLIRLAQMTVAWRWTVETEAVLWEIVSRHPGEKWAFKNLTTLLYASGKTRALKTLLEKLSEAEPDNLAVRNNLAMAALLLTPDDPTAHRLARECYEAAPGNPHFVSTHAFALSCAGKPDEAMKLFDELAEEKKSDTIRIYVGLVLAQAGRGAEALPWLNDWEKTRLLPEEVALVKKALANQPRKDA